jgi:hypothetical protein
MPDALRRAIRTFAQVAVAAAVLAAYNVFAPEHLRLSTEQQAAIIAVLTPLFSYLQNLAEDAGAIPALLKAPASDGAEPVK